MIDEVTMCLNGQVATTTFDFLCVGSYPLMCSFVFLVEKLCHGLSYGLPGALLDE